MVTAFLPPDPNLSSPIADSLKTEVVSRARAIAAELFNSHTTSQQCVVMSICTIIAMAEKGIPALLAAGNMSWFAVAPECDDGVSATAYSFYWDLSNPLSMGNYIRIENALKYRKSVIHCPPPEIHLWTICVPDMAIVDLTVESFPHQFEKATGLKWSRPLPPICLWSTPDESRYFYHASPVPTQFAFRYVMAILEEVNPVLRQMFSNYLKASREIILSKMRDSKAA